MSPIEIMNTQQLWFTKETLWNSVRACKLHWSKKRLYIEWEKLRRIDRIQCTNVFCRFSEEIILFRQNKESEDDRNHISMRKFLMRIFSMRTRSQWSQQTFVPRLLDHQLQLDHLLLLDHCRINEIHCCWDYLDVYSGCLKLASLFPFARH